MSQCCLSFLERSRGYSPTEGTLPVRLPSLQSRRHVRLFLNSMAICAVESYSGVSETNLQLGPLHAVIFYLNIIISILK